MSNTLSVAIDGMSCGHCVTSVQRALNGLPEVDSAVVAVGGATVTLSRDAAPASAATAVISALRNAGYDSTVREAPLTSHGARSSCCSTRPSTSGSKTGAVIAALEPQTYDSEVDASATSAERNIIRSRQVTDPTTSANASI